ncbi:MAG: hypothetical protein WA151_17935 [Desulfatirhabdiaceae bacterium]
MMNRRPEYPLTNRTLFILLILSCHSSALAGYISINIQASVTVSNKQLSAHITLTNRGDEAAQTIQPQIWIQKERITGDVIPRMLPSASHSFTLNHSLNTIKKGKYPLVIWVDFHDANQYPFSAVSGMTFFVDQDTVSDLAIQTGPVVMDHEGMLELKLKNLGNDARNLNFLLVVPRELSTHSIPDNILVAPRKETGVSLKISNFSALYGATYPIFCFVEYESDDAHYCQLASSVVRIEAGRNWFRKTRTGWMIGVAILILILAGYLIRMARNRWKQKNSDPIFK